MPIKKYQLVADTISQQILTGYFQPGEKIPSVRASCEQFHVSMTTVQAAYEILEDNGLVTSRPSSGYFVSRLADTEHLTPIKPQGISVYNRMISVLNDCHKEGVINLGTAVVSPSLLPTHQIKKILNKLTRDHMLELVTPEFSSGYPPLRREFAKRMLNVNVEVHPDDILVTGGCQDAIALALSAVANAGDVIAVESPCFPGLLQVIESLDMKALPLPCSGSLGMKPDTLQDALQSWPISAIVLVPSFSNPTGSLMPIESRKRVIALVEEYDIALIEDDLFSELNYQDKPVPAIKSLEMKGNVIYCSSVSKSLGSGFRLGWLCGGKYHSKIMKLKAFRNVSEPLIIQMLIAELMKQGGYSKHLKKLKIALHQNQKLMQSCIKKSFPKGTLVNSCDGGYVLWVQLPDLCDSRELFTQAIKSGVAFFPGDVFSPHEHYLSYIRFNLAVKWCQEIEQAVISLGKLVKLQLERSAVQPPID
ncbi:PLP-dependent aminotransferase family protein [Shewanella woodyi]|uniref:aminotransferase-like domain-containing protein n=1 Tax=Shewanella woodyi TaxID=60961 RepID=UPI003748E502